MKTSQNTVLITGGSAGIGFEIAKLFASKNNQVIITGRDPKRLEKAVSQIPNAVGIVSDVAQSQDVELLVKKLKTEFPKLNIVINNAGRAFVHGLSENTNTFSNASEEIATNYLSIIRLNEQLLPLLKMQPEAAIVHVSSIAAFVPNRILATYAASKAALHSYSLSLRLALAKTSNIKVFELMPPLVNTDFSQEIGGEKGISPVVVAEELLKGFIENRYEIRVGNTQDIYELSLASPDDALLAMNPGY